MTDHGFNDVQATMHYGGDRKSKCFGTEVEIKNYVLAAFEAFRQAAINNPPNGEYWPLSSNRTENHAKAET